MKLKINFTGTNKKVPFANQHLVNSFIHKCLGNNNKYHDTPSNYSISSLLGGKWDGVKSLDFSNGSFIVVSSIDKNFLDDLIFGLLKNKQFTHDMEFKNVDFPNETFYNGINHFFLLSPFILKEYKSKDKYRFRTFKDDDFEEYLNRHTINKLLKINPKLNLKNFKIEINSEKCKVKRIMVKNILNIANQCQLSVHCSKQVAELLSNVGVGQSCGSGFGSLCKTEDIKLFRN